MVRVRAMSTRPDRRLRCAFENNYYCISSTDGFRKYYTQALVKKRQTSRYVCTYNLMGTGFPEKRSFVENSSNNSGIKKRN